MEIKRSSPTALVICSHCLWVRWSFHNSAGLITSPDESRNTEPCICPVSPIPATRSPVSAATFSITSLAPSHQSSGSCSVQPGCGLWSGYSEEASASTSPESSTATALAPPVPTSRPIRTLTPLSCWRALLCGGWRSPPHNLRSCRARRRPLSDRPGRRHGFWPAKPDPVYFPRQVPDELPLQDGAPDGGHLIFCVGIEVEADHLTFLPVTRVL